MHCGIPDRHFHVFFFVEIQLKKENFKSVLWAPEFGHPNRCICLLNGLNSLLIDRSSKLCLSNVWMISNFARPCLQLIFTFSHIRFKVKNSYWFTMFFQTIVDLNMYKSSVQKPQPLISNHLVFHGFSH